MSRCHPLRAHGLEIDLSFESACLIEQVLFSMNVDLDLYDGLDQILSQIAEDTENRHYELQELNDSNENLLLSQIPLDDENGNASFDLGTDFLSDPFVVPTQQDQIIENDVNKSCVKTDLSDERFGKQTTDEEIQELVSSNRNKNTIKKHEMVAERV